MAEDIKEAKNVKEEKTNKEKTVKIKLPRISKEDSDVFVSVNERTWLIKRGVEVEVPECVAEVLQHQEEMQEEAYDFANSVKQ